MQSNKKRYLIIGIIISILLSLFVNYLLFSLNIEVVLTGEAMVAPNMVDKTLLLFSFMWFAAFSFILYLITIVGIEQGKKYLGKEYKAIILMAIVDMLFVFLIIQCYSAIESSFSKTAVFVAVEGQDGEIIINEVDEDTILDHPDFSSSIQFDSISSQYSDMSYVSTVSDTMFHRPVITEHLFVFVTVFMFVLLLRILKSRQEMELRIEKLQKENLQSAYNALMGQINPHFFFNSLGGLNSLIRSGEQERTLTYLEELTSVFRYILQSSHKEIVSLSEELEFVKAYIYLLSIRYEGKLFFSLDIDPLYLSYRLPVLSVLPLIGNAIKHNIVSKSLPLTISVSVDTDHNLLVSNPLQVKVEAEDCTGIGLKNLSGRYKLLTHKDIVIKKLEKQFEVQLPLLEPLKEG